MLSPFIAFLISTSGSEPLSGREYRSLPPATLDRTVRDDLLSVLQRLKKLPSGNRIGVGDITLTTKGFATGTPNVCARDWITIRYAPINRARDSGDGGIRPYAVDAERQYYFLKAPSASTLKETNPTFPWSHDCEKAAEIEYDGWFTADDEYTAVRTYMVFRAGVEAVQSDVAKLAECDRGGGRDCIQQFQTLASSADFGAFGRCDDQADADDCYVIEVAGHEVRVHAKRNSDATDPLNVTRVTAHGIIVVT